MSTITDQQVSEYLLARLDEIHAVKDYGGVAVEIHAHRDQAREVKFRVVAGQGPRWAEAPSFAAAFDLVKAKLAGTSESDELREQARALMAQADQIDKVASL